MRVFTRLRRAWSQPSGWNVLLVTLQVVAVNSSVSWAICSITYRALGISFPPGAAHLIATYAPIVLPAVVAPVTTIPRLRLAHRLHRANAQLLEEVRRREELGLELEYRATHDALTGVRNRRGFFEQAPAVLDDGVVVVVVDLDRFKAVNDGCGHAAGDVLLQTVARALRAVGEPVGGLVGRLGGDEFVVLLPPGAEGVAEQIRVDLAEVSLRLPDGRTVQTSASVGIARSRAGATLSGVLASADHGMYVHKQGRGTSGVDASGIGAEGTSDCGRLPA